MGANQLFAHCICLFSGSIRELSIYYREGSRLLMGWAKIFFGGLMGRVPNLFNGSKGGPNF